MPYFPPPSSGSGIPATLVDAKGDILTATANDTPARLAVGTDTHVLTADSTQATGVKWAAAAGGGVSDGAQYLAGYYYPGTMHVVSDPGGSIALTAGTLFCVPFAVTESTPFDRLALQVETAGGGSAVIRMGVYTSTRLTPTTRVFEGSVSATSTGLKSLTISNTLSPGLYWMVAVSNDSTVVGRATGDETRPVFQLGQTAGDWLSHMIGLRFTGYDATVALPSTATTAGRTNGHKAQHDTLLLELRAA